MSAFLASEIRAITEKTVVDAFNYSLYSKRGAQIVDGGHPATPGQIKAKLAAQIYTNTPLVWGLLNIGSNAIKTVPFDVVRTYANLNRTEIVKNHAINDLLNFVNPNMTIQEFVEYVYKWSHLAGSVQVAVLEVEDPEYRKQSKLGLWPLDPKFVTPIPSANDDGILGYRYAYQDKEVFFSRKEIISFRNFNPIDPYLGLSTLNPLSLDIQIDQAAKQQRRNYHLNSTRIQGFLIAEDTLQDDQYNRIRKQFMANYSGPSNAYKIGILEQGMTYSPLSENKADLFMGQIDASVQKMYQIVLGVPLVLLTIETSRLQLIEVERTMWALTLKPYLTNFCENINKQLIRVIDKRYSIVPNYQKVDALRMYELDQVRTQVAKVITGISTPNEIRATENYPPFTGEYAEFGDAPQPYFTSHVNANHNPGGVSPSLTLPGSMGGRDQSDGGEAQMADVTGQRNVQQEILLKFINEGTQPKKEDN